MKHNLKFVLSVAGLALSAAANAQQDSLFGDGAWYAGVRTAYVGEISSDGQFVGPTESVYGGTPLIEMDDGTQFTFAIGREIFENLRFEFEFSYLTSDTKSAWVSGEELRADDLFSLRADVDSTIVMVNLGYDFNQLNWWANPYVRGGIGVAENDVDALLDVEYNSAIWQGTANEGQVLTDHVFPGRSSSEFAWQFAAGFKKAMSDRFDLRFEYSFLNRGEAWTGLDDNDDAAVFSGLESQQLTLGLDYKFN